MDCCRCIEKGYTSIIGLEKFHCNLTENEHCPECEILAKERYDDFMTKVNEMVSKERR